MSVIRPPKRIAREESGASAVLIALSMIVLMGLVAIAVDGGLGFNERRQAQSGADFGALAGALLSNYPGPTPAECSGLSDGLEQAACRGAVEAIDAVQGNLPTRQLDWAACTDPITDASSPFHASNGGFTPQVELIGGVPADGGTMEFIDCIHFSQNTHQVRVAVPTISLDTTFARVLGFNTIEVSAVAEVAGEIPEEAVIVPFAIPANHESSYDCLKTGPNPDWGVCKDLSSNGNFGYADIPVYGVESFGTEGNADNCNPTNNSLVSNMVRGIDHWVVGHPNGVVDSSNPAYRDDKGTNTADRFFVCPAWPGNANEISLQGGVVSGDFEDGLIWGYGTSERGRLWDESVEGIQVRTPGGGHPATWLNDKPLWDYLNGNEVAVCGGTPGNTQEMIDCLEAWSPGDPVIFESGSTGIRFAERFAYAPLLYDDFGPQSWYLIEELLPIFFHTTYYACTSGGGAGVSGVCDIIHVPGESGVPNCDPVMTAPTPGDEPPDTSCGITGPGQKQLSAVTTFILDVGMLPDDALLPFTSQGPLINIHLTD